MSNRNRKQPMTPAVGFGMSDLLTKRVEQAEEASRKLQEAVRAANEAFKGMEEQKKALEAQRSSLDDEIFLGVKTRIEDAVEDCLKVLGVQIEDTTKKSEEAVQRRFDRLSDILLGKETGNGGKSLQQYAEDIQEVFQLNWDVFYSYLISALSVSKGCNLVGCEGVAKYAILMKNFRVPDDLTKDVIPEGADPMDFALEGHMHVCVVHYDAAKMTGEVLRSFKLETRVCPFPHGSTKSGSVKLIPDQTSTEEN
jgi:hypothetical protein